MGSLLRHRPEYQSDPAEPAVYVPTDADLAEAADYFEALNGERSEAEPEANAAERREE